MNWQIKELENRAIVSFSDAHSGIKLGREATVFITKTNQLNSKITKFSYQDIISAIKQTPDSKFKIGYTIEFFPEEGKYHWSGHRLCGIKRSPWEIKEKGITCPVCHKPLTIGVESRVFDLSERLLKPNDLLFIPNKNGIIFVADKEKKRRPFVSLVPLLEILTETEGGSIVKAQKQYEQLVSTLGSEFDILLKKTIQEIEKAGGEKLAKAIKIVRERKVFIDPGYDGVFGTIKIFKNNEKKNSQENQQINLF